MSKRNGLPDLTPAVALVLEFARRAAGKTNTGDAGQDSDGFVRKNRNNYLSDEAYRLTRQGRSEAQVLDVLLGLNDAICRPPLPEREVRDIAHGKRKVGADPAPAFVIEDFHAYSPEHKFMCGPTRTLWPAISVDRRLPKQDGMKPSEWLDKYRAIDQMTWAPGEPALIRERVIDGSGWVAHANATVLNLYRPPVVVPGDPAQATRWLDHIRRIYPTEREWQHIVQWLAHRVQKPGDKPNHGLVLGGKMGIGKDTILEPVKYGVGPWNFEEVSPQQLMGRFNGFVKSVVLRVNEARDQGDTDRFAFYDHTKAYMAAPPDVLSCDEKNLREYAVVNVMGVVLTTNHKTNGIYLPADDRRHFVVWSDSVKEDFTAKYWNDLWRWYSAGGIGHVVAYLRTLDLSGFDPKAPPPKTDAFWAIVDANRAPEDARMMDAIEAAGNPDAITIGMVIDATHDPEFIAFLQDRKYARHVPGRFDDAGYVVVRNTDAKDGLWSVRNRRVAVYAKATLSLGERIKAARKLAAAAVVKDAGYGP